MNGLTLLQSAAAHTGLPLTVLLGRGRSARLVMVRICVMHVASRELGYSSIEIGRLLRRDSSCGRHLLSRSDFRIANEPGYRRLHGLLMTALEGGAV